jgi:hypothetical protein
MVADTFVGAKNAATTASLCGDISIDTRVWIAAKGI